MSGTLRVHEPVGCFTVWPHNQFTTLIGTRLPIIQAPMAGASGTEMAIAVAEAGALGSLPCAMLDTAQARTQLAAIRQATDKPINANFFCHAPPPADEDRQQAWRARLAPYYAEYGIDPDITLPAVNRAPFDADMCEVVEAFKPEVVSFHFGLPAAALIDRVKATGAVVLSSATSVAEARWLELHGCDAVIAQGYEAGGHRGMFLSDDVSTQTGTMALIPQVVDAVSLPVIAAGGIADGRGIVAALALGACAVQIGTAYLYTPEALISDLHREALSETPEGHTALTNIFSGRPARGLINRVMRELGPMTPSAPAFPTAGGALAPLKNAAEKMKTPDFTSLWAGQASPLRHGLNATELTHHLHQETTSLLESLG